MGNNKSLFIGNLLYAFISNAIALIVSSFIVLVIPKYLSIEDYGYWQLYLFYSSYIGFLQFGWTDGVYLRYGGEKYEILNRKVLFSQFWMLVIFQTIISCSIFFVSGLFVLGRAETFIIFTLSICTVITGSRAMLIFVLQATNRINDYSRITISDRIIFLLFVLCMIFTDFKSYKMIIVADLMGKIISLIYSLYICKNIVINKISDFRLTFRETYDNINAGIKLMFTNIASMLIVGIIRFGIERTWEVSTFGKVSLTLSISNVMMIFINAVGMLLFPLLRRTSKENMTKLYSTIRNVLIVVMYGALLLYYPINVFISHWLPQYSDILKYMVFLFPVFVFEGKLSLLANTFYKTLRKEKIMLLINIASVFLSFVLTIISTIILKNLTLSIMSILLAIAFRSTLSEYILSKLLKINIREELIYELLLTLVFVLIGWFSNSKIVTVLYIIVYSFFIIKSHKKINESVIELKKYWNSAEKVDI